MKKEEMICISCGKDRPYHPSGVCDICSKPQVEDVDLYEELESLRHELAG